MTTPQGEDMRLQLPCPSVNVPFYIQKMPFCPQNCPELPLYFPDISKVSFCFLELLFCFPEVPFYFSKMPYCFSQLPFGFPKVPYFCLLGGLFPKMLFFSTDCIDFTSCRELLREFSFHLEIFID